MPTHLRRRPTLPEFNDLLNGLSMAVAFGFKTWNFDPGFTSTGTAPTQGTVYGVAVYYRKGQVVTYTDWAVTAAGVGTAPTHIYTGIADSTGKILAKSNDDAANADWKVASKYVRSPLSAAYTIPASGFYYHVILQVGAWGTTQMTLSRATGPFNLPNGKLAQMTGVTTGQTALPNVGSVLAGGITATNSLRYWSGSE